MTTGDDDPVPVELTPSVIAELCGVSRKRAVTRLGHAGLLERAGPRLFVVSPTMLRERLPDWYQRVYNHFFFKRERDIHSRPPPPAEPVTHVRRS